MRCPHCASTRLAPPVCMTCGQHLDEPAGQPQAVGIEVTIREVPDVLVATMPGLTPTAHAAVEVQPERLVGLITNEEATGETHISVLSDSGSVHCPHCGAEVSREPSCSRCGRSMKPGAQKADGAPCLRCLECGVPNPPGSARCLVCGSEV